MISRKLARKVLCGMLAVGCASVTGGAFAGSVIGDVTIDNIKTTPTASTGTFSIGSDSSSNVSIENTGSAIGSSDSDYNGSILGNEIKLTSQNGCGAIANTGAHLTIGNDKTDKITITSGDDGIRAIQGYVSLNANEVSIDCKAEAGSAAIWLQNNTQDKDAPVNPASVTIKAEKIDLRGNEFGVVAYSNGQLTLNGDTTITGKNALDVRGHSTTNINTDGKHSTVLNGDIVFETPATPQDNHSSGNIIDANVNVNLTGKGSSWTGCAYQEYKTNDADSEYKHVIEMDTQPYQGNVTGFKLTMADGASWNMTGDSFVNDVNASGDSTIHVGSNVKMANMQNVTLDKATIDLAGDHQTVNVTDTLSGNGTIATNSLDNKLTAADAADADITVKGSGDIADQIAGDSAVAQKLAGVAVNEEGKSIAKSLKTDAGTIAGEYSAQVDKNGKVFNEVKSQNQTNLSISKLGALSLMTWRQENNDMNKRLGEIRDSQGEQGIWARMSRGEAKYGAQGVKNQYNYYQLGYDHKIADDWILGGAFTYTDGENNLVGGSGTNKNTGFAVYGSNLRDDGSFIDLIAKYAHMKNDFDTIGGVGIGEYSTNGYALSAEYGKRFQQDGFWIEPQAELTYGKVSSADFTTSEGAKVHQDSLDSLVGRLGFSLGKDVKAGNVYVRASYLYDFKGDVAMRMSNGVASDTYDQDLGGSWWEFGVGTNLNFGKDMHFYFDVERTEGGKIDTPWQWNAGVRLSF